MISLNKNHINQSNTTVRTNSNSETDRIDRYTAPTADMSVYKKYEQIIKDNIGYDDFVISKKPYELQEIDEIVEINRRRSTYYIIAFIRIIQSAGGSYR